MICSMARAPIVKIFNLIRMVELVNLKFNRRVFVKYVQSQKNELADALSRMDLDSFFRKAGKIELEPMPIPEQLWPVQKIWIN